MKKKQSNEILDAMSRNPANWRGVFYVNKKDPRLIVPKLNPQLGWTFNFGSIYSYIAIILFIAIIVLSQIFF